MTLQSPNSETTDSDNFSVDFLIYEGQYVDQKYVQIHIEEDVGNLIFNPLNAYYSIFYILKYTDLFLVSKLS